MPQSAYGQPQGGILWSVRRHLQQVGDVTISERVSSSDEIYDPLVVDESLAVDVSPAVKVLPAEWMIGSRQAFLDVPWGSTHHPWSWYCRLRPCWTLAACLILHAESALQRTQKEAHGSFSEQSSNDPRETKEFEWRMCRWMAENGLHCTTSHCPKSLTSLGQITVSYLEHSFTFPYFTYGRQVFHIRYRGQRIG